jgi:hypothetical protein
VRLRGFWHSSSLSAPDFPDNPLHISGRECYNVLYHT